MLTCVPPYSSDALLDNIGNSDDYTVSFQLNGVDNTPDYSFSCRGIAWPSDAQRYAKTEYNPGNIVPPRNWIGWRYRGSTIANSTWPPNNVFDPTEDEHFQVTIFEFLIHL